MFQDQEKELHLHLYPHQIIKKARGVVFDSDEKKLVTPRTDALESAKSAYENSLAGSQLLFPDDEFDQLSVASSIIADTPML